MDSMTLAPSRPARSAGSRCESECPPATPCTSSRGISCGRRRTPGAAGLAPREDNGCVAAPSPPALLPLPTRVLRLPHSRHAEQRPAMPRTSRVSGAGSRWWGRAPRCCPQPGADWGGPGPPRDDQGADVRPGTQPAVRARRDLARRAAAAHATHPGCDRGAGVVSAGHDRGQAPLCPAHRSLLRRLSCSCGQHGVPQQGCPARAGRQRRKPSRPIPQAWAGAQRLVSTAVSSAGS